MKKKITIFMLAVLTVVICTGIFAMASCTEQTEVVTCNIESEETSVVTLEASSVSYAEVPDIDFSVERLEVFVDESLDSYTMDELQALINEANTDKEAASKLAEAARELGWPEESESIESAKAEWWNAQLKIETYTAKYNELFAAAEAERIRWEKKMSEYPAATTVWLFLKDMGYNDYVCAGIMGNLMAEVGGQTLKLQYMLYSDDGYFGMCQWSKGYGQIWGKGLEDQCNFLKNTIKYEMDTFGNIYKRGFNLNAFLAMDDAREAALAFAKCYERCHSRTYTIRQNNAEKAYNYFVNQ